MQMKHKFETFCFHFLLLFLFIAFDLSVMSPNPPTIS
jgi:hypothetical protein